MFDRSSTQTTISSSGGVIMIDLSSASPPNIRPVDDLWESVKETVWLFCLLSPSYQVRE